MFKPMSNTRPFLKMAFEGFAGDGKTFTATAIAIGLHKHIGSTKPIAFFDTEKASKALKGILAEAGIEAVVADEHRSLSALNQAIQWCEQGGADILIIDSITHVWEEYMQAYMKEKRRTRLEFQDWGIIKPKWKAEFSTPFVNARVHIIFTGRAGYTYDDEKNAETGRREIVKSGIKMKAETETAFEPDLLVLMEKEQNLLGSTKTVQRIATVLKDRTDRIDGARFVNPTYQDFYPAIAVLLDGVSRADTQQPIADRFEDIEAKSGENNRRRELLIAEIGGVFQAMGLGQSTVDKKLKVDTLNKLYGGFSMEALQKVRLKDLETGLHILKQFAAAYAAYLESIEGAAPDPKHVDNLLQYQLDIAKAVEEEVGF
jgi:hypothetical protein